MSMGTRVAVLIVSTLALPNPAIAQPLDPDAINHASVSDDQGSRVLATKLQVLLARHHFSPGVIDGRMGENVLLALGAYRQANGLPSSDAKLDRKTWSKLIETAPDKVIVSYTITSDDTKGPFTSSIPDDFEQERKLDHLGYTSPREMLAEKFHMDQDFLKELNPDADFTKAESSIFVANVEPSGGDAGQDVHRVEVDKSSNQVRAYGEDDQLLAVYPATVGSKERPAPSGTLEVKGVAEDPTYTYHPSLDFAGVNAKQPFTMAPGPNNPVGLVWIELSKDGYGIHGTPEPAEIGKTASHGCVRLTNWDAQALAKRVKPGVKVEFVGST
ncbi:L,D-transpeptidase family protein [Bradyrhizobium sp. P5_C11_2]